MKLGRTRDKEKHTANLQLVKETNLTLIFNLIDKHESVSRAELAQITRLSPTTVSSLTEELIHNGMVVESGAGTTSTSGRKPIMLEMNPDGGYVVSVEMTEAGYNCSLYNLKCKEIGGKKVLVTDFDQVGTSIVDTIDQLLRSNQKDEGKLLGICIGAPGLIDTEKNRILSSTVISIDYKNDFYDRIKERFSSIPVFLGNESSFSAYAEKRFGRYGQVKNLVFIEINIGIGAGIILNDKIFTGAFGLAGEIGHMSIDINGPRCKCGNKGCLEMMASIPAMSQKIIFAIMSGRATLIRDIIQNDYNKVNIDVIKEAVDQKDELAVEVMTEVALRVAFGINNIINLFNTEAVVIGGEITKLGDAFLRKVKEEIAGIQFKPNLHMADIGYSTVGGNHAVLGAARFVLDHVFTNKELLGK